MREDLLTRLLKGEHFSMEERQSSGLILNEVLLYEQVLQHLATVLDAVEWFPTFPPEYESNPPLDGIWIHKESSGKFTVVAASTSPIYSSVLAQHTFRVFDSAIAAAEYYLKWELHLPGNLDGWSVI